MTKKESWICDICKEEFKEGDAGYDVNIGFEIIIPSGGQFENQSKFKFEDTCLGCRTDLTTAIEAAIK